MASLRKPVKVSGRGTRGFGRAQAAAERGPEPPVAPSCSASRGAARGWNAGNRTLVPEAGHRVAWWGNFLRRRAAAGFPAVWMRPLTESIFRRDV